jgi:hypothetical protein
MSSAPFLVDPVTPPCALTIAIEGRLAEWKRSFLELPPCEEWLLRDACVQSLRLERDEGHEDRLIARFMTRAALAWEQDRELAVEELAAGLARKPVLISARLRSSRHGCLGMIKRWKSLSAQLEANDDWTEPQRGMALDLLGIAPEFRDGTTRLDPPAPANPLETRRLVIERELDSLHSLATGPLQELDDEERMAAEEGVGAERDPGIKALRRNLDTYRRRIDWCIRQLKPFKMPVEADQPPALILPAPLPPIEPMTPPDPESDPEPPPELDPTGRAIANYLARAKQPSPPAEVVSPEPVFTGNRLSRRTQKARHRKGR